MLFCFDAPATVFAGFGMHDEVDYDCSGRDSVGDESESKKKPNGSEGHFLTYPNVRHSDF